MKILIVSSYKAHIPGGVSYFIQDQVEALRKRGIEIDYYLIKGKGMLGYLKNLPAYIKKINEFKPALIHAHYGLSGVFANLQRKIPVLTTYHGSDINVKKAYYFSRLSMLLSAHNIFVSVANITLSQQNKRFSLIPCGVDTTVFYAVDKEQARAYFGYNASEKLVLFAGDFENEVKNSALAKKAMEEITDAKLIELKGYKRTEVALLMNAVDACLMTSRTEGSPQFIKEALACHCPIVSVKVGDVPELIAGVEGCYLVNATPHDIRIALQHILKKNARTMSDNLIEAKELSQKKVTEKILNLYNKYGREK